MAKPTACPRCARENDPSFAFCLDCGQPLRAPPPSGANTCATCGAVLQPGFRFCGICGRPVVAPPPPPRAETDATVQTPRPPALPYGPSPRLRLTAMRSDGTPGASYPIVPPELGCGRIEGAVRFPDDATVSPRHARFTVSGGVLRVEDLGSVNGTFLRLRAPRRISVGEEIRVGRQLLRLEPFPRAARADAVVAWGSADRGYRLRLSQLLEGGGLGEVFPLADGENVIGREAGAITFPADRYVSARHACLEVRGDDVTLADAGSSNGTFVKVAGAAELGLGDQLLVGGQLLRVEA